jgi:hypothetical protein|uniref:Uncharacterized protein n=1 Tax=Myoviridae sp. ctPJU6 TaxID=2827684 RepID=A0A8S5TJ24_9CAUD|nr:MAG TPA: hypothetical protein [Myoviridae sp. ctPJU6]
MKKRREWTRPFNQRNSFSILFFAHLFATPLQSVPLFREKPRIFLFQSGLAHGRYAVFLEGTSHLGSRGCRCCYAAASIDVNVAQASDKNWPNNSTNSFLKANVDLRHETHV